jgi:hypothetical protein
MEIILIIYMVMLGGFWVWCFWWGLRESPKYGEAPWKGISTHHAVIELLKALGSPKRHLGLVGPVVEISWVEMVEKHYNGELINGAVYIIKEMQAPPVTIETERTFWPKVLPATNENMEILNEYWKNTQK